MCAQCIYAGLDFSPALVEHVFQPGTDTVDEWLSIELMDDEILEMEEVFLVRLNVSLTDPQDEAELDVERQWLLIRIRPDKDGNWWERLHAIHCR